MWAGGRLSPQDLANALVAAGAVRGMQLDINPDWVNFNTYDVGADGVAHGNGVFGATGADRYLRPDGRDFIAVLVRGTVAKGATAKLGPRRCRPTSRCAEPHAKRSPAKRAARNEPPRCGAQGKALHARGLRLRGRPRGAGVRGQPPNSTATQMRPLP